MRTLGLIGYPLSHSFSKKYFTDKFEREGIKGYEYSLFPIETIEGLKPLLDATPELEGLNVTIPYKEQVIPFLDECSPIVAEIGACNCIRIQDGRLVGYNTDVIGFAKTLEPKLAPHHQHALVLGTGGAAKAVHYVLKQKGIGFLEVSRTSREGVVTYDNLDRSVMGKHTLIINTTPLGMYPKTEEAPPIPYGLIDSRHYLYDLVYNPSKTRFLALGEEKGATIENGADMLVIQAEASWDIWNSANG